MSVTSQAVLDVEQDTVEFLDGLTDKRTRRDTRTRTRAPGTCEQAILALRWFIDDTRMSDLARDNAISLPTAYAYTDEAPLPRLPLANRTDRSRGAGAAPS